MMSPANSLIIFMTGLFYMNMNQSNDQNANIFLILKYI